MTVDVNSIRAAAAFADAVAKGLENLEYNRPIASKVVTEGLIPTGSGPVPYVDELCQNVAEPTMIRTLNDLWKTQQRLAQLLQRLAVEK